eukprot:scaffold139_cov246-Pinguiococcus_pyrenoidosus.AAC.10
MSEWTAPRYVLKGTYLESRLLEGVLVEGRDLLLVRVLVVVRGDLERQIRGVLQMADGNW